MGKPGPPGHSASYWAVSAAAFLFLAIDLFDDRAIWNVAVVLCIVIAIVVRPGGAWRRRPAAQAAE